MNYYEHHIGDYAEATAHLTFVEDAAYSRLIRKYYAAEKPMPADLKAVQRLVGARSKDEREAVQTILEEFFELREDGWHNARCDAEIKAYNDGEPERSAKKANEETRLRRHREERAALFKTLTEAGQHAPWNTPIAELRETVKRITENAQETNPETLRQPLPATSPATPATATQTPDTIPQTPEVYSVPIGTDAAGVKPGDPPPADPPKPPMEPDEIIFGYGVPLLVNAGSADKAARSFLGGLRKQHGDTAVIDKLRDCIRAKPLQPLEWLAAALPPRGAKKAENKQEAIEARNRGVADEWASTPAGAAT